MRADMLPAKPLTNRLHNGGDTLSAGDAERGQTIAGAPPAHLVEESGEDARAGAAQWVPEGDGATVRVDVGYAVGDVQVLDARESLSGERFVEFDDAQVAKRETGEFQRFARGRRGPKPMISGGTPATAWLLM